MFSDLNNKGMDDHFYFEIKITTEAGKATEQVDLLVPRIDALIDTLAPEDNSIYFKPKISALDDSTIAIGLKIHFENTQKVPEEIATVLNHAGQHAHFTVELGTSITDTMKSEEPVLKSLSKGFKVTSKVCIISNMKKIFLELAKDETFQDKIGNLMMFAPATMLTLNGKLDFDFDDMEEIENHPMAAPLMMTFEQLFEGGLGSSPNEMLKNELDT